MLAGLARAGVVSLPADDPASWTRFVFAKDVGVTEAEACGFTMTRYGGRACLVIGPWRAGEWSARWQWAKPLPPAEGILGGWYRTEGVLPCTAEASYGWLKGKDRLRRDSVALAPATEWTRFAVAVRRPSPGADGVTFAVGLSEHSEGRAWFAGLAFTASVTAAAFPAGPQAVTRPAPPASWAAGRRFRLEHAGNTWWLVTPAGTPFYSVGTDAPGFKTAADGARRAGTIRSAGFNSLGGWSDVWAWGRLDGALTGRGEQPFAAFVAIETSDLGACGVLIDPTDRETAGGHAFPDPFDPAFAPAYGKLVADVAGAAAGKPWLAGWFMDNERDHDRLDRRVWSGHAGKAFRAWLERKYPTPAALNAAWDSSFASFDEVGKKTPVSGIRRGGLYEDCREFARVIVARYVQIAVGEIRRADPGALVFTNRFMLGGIADTLEYLDAYAPCDGVAVNVYPANRTAGLSDNERAVLAEIHRCAGKPILIGEWSVPALDSGLYADPAKLDWSYPEAVASQVERARQAACVTVDFYNLPFVVGAHWFTWRDFDSPKRKANRGLFRSNGEPWRELIDALAAVHARLPGVPPLP